jgi:hypothetical protein
LIQILIHKIYKTFCRDLLSKLHEMIEEKTNLLKEKDISLKDETDELNNFKLKNKIICEKVKEIIESTLNGSSKGDTTNGENDLTNVLFW